MPLCRPKKIKRCERKKDAKEKKMRNKKDVKEKKTRKKKRWSERFHSLLWLIGSIYDLEAGQLLLPA